MFTCSFACLLVHLRVCLFICVFACSFACLLVHLRVCLFICVFACSFACLLVHLRVCLFICVFACSFACLLVHLRVCLFICVFACSFACLLVHLRVCLFICVFACSFACLLVHLRVCLFILCVCLFILCVCCVFSCSFCVFACSFCVFAVCFLVHFVCLLVHFVCLLVHLRVYLFICSGGGATHHVRGCVRLSRLPCGVVLGHRQRITGVPSDGGRWGGRLSRLRPLSSSCTAGQAWCRCTTSISRSSRITSRGSRRSSTCRGSPNWPAGTANPLPLPSTSQDIIGKALPLIGTYNSLDNMAQVVALIDEDMCINCAQVLHDLQRFWLPGHHL